MDILDLIQEVKGEFGKGGGRKSAVSGGRVSDVSRSNDKAKSEKGRVTVYKSIDDALHKGYFGQIFSTTGSERLYVITRKKWGKSGQQTVGNKTAKGFSAGSIPSSFGDIKSYSIRTLRRHGGKKQRHLDANSKLKEGSSGIKRLNRVALSRAKSGVSNRDNLAKNVYKGSKSNYKNKKSGDSLKNLSKKRLDQMHKDRKLD